MTETPAARLDFRVEPTVRTILDGAWWPRTRDTASELAALIVALDARDTPLSLIMLNPSGWQSHPRRIQAADRIVRVAWFVDLDQAVLTATTTDHERIDLLVTVEDDPADSTPEALSLAGDGELAPADRPGDREGRED